MFGLDDILMGAGGLGMLKGLFSSNQTPSLSDVNLQRDNPELYQQLQQMQSVVGEYQNAYNQRRQGATAGELAGMAQSRAADSSRMGNLGLIGSSAGQSMMGGFEAQQQNALQQRIFQERQQALQGLQGAQQNYTSALGNAQSQDLQALMGQHQGNLAGQTAQNQFFSGMLGSGLNLYGTGQYLNTMQNGAMQNAGLNYNPNVGWGIGLGAQYTTPYGGG